MCIRDSYNTYGVDENKLDLIFKAYDIRGIYGETLTPEIAFKIGFAYADFVDSEKIIIGHDGRLSNKEMLNAVASGVKKKSKSILYIGTVPTDVVYSLSGLENLPGIVITASHNPKEWTGLKFCNKGARPIGIETGLLDIKEKVENLDIDIEIQTEFQEEDIVDSYIEHLNSLVNPADVKNTISFIIDAGNGALGSVIEELHNSYKLNFDELYMEVDGNFPNHPADPSDPENLRELKELVISKNKAFGVAFDGDADRLIVSDEKGNIIDGDQLLAVLAIKLQREGELKNSTIVGTSMTNHAFDLWLNNIGINLMRTDVGDRYISEAIKQFDYSLGGEPSGHILIPHLSKTGDALMNALIILCELVRENKLSSNFFKKY